MDIIANAYSRFCTERFSLPAEDEILRIESRIGVRLPDDYRWFLAKFNGGIFNEPRILPPSKDCPVDRLTGLNGIGANDAIAELASNDDLTLFDDNDPVQVLPVGFTMMGGLILLTTHIEERGSILLKVAYGGSFYLCGGIRDFFGLLSEPPPDE